MLSTEMHVTRVDHAVNSRLVTSNWCVQLANCAYAPVFTTLMDASACVVGHCLQRCIPVVFLVHDVHAGLHVTVDHAEARIVAVSSRVKRSPKVVRHALHETERESRERSIFQKICHDHVGRVLTSTQNTKYTDTVRLAGKKKEEVSDNCTHEAPYSSTQTNKSLCASSERSVSPAYYIDLYTPGTIQTCRRDTFARPLPWTRKVLPARSTVGPRAR